MYCQNCGKEVTGNFCPDCGAAVSGSAPAQAVATQPRPDQTNAQPTIIINNTNTNTNTNMNPQMLGREKNKWVAFLLCLFLGVVGAHKFYEGKIGMGILYIFTFGLFGIGWIIDLIALLGKPNPYYV